MRQGGELGNEQLKCLQKISGDQKSVELYQPRMQIMLAAACFAREMQGGFKLRGSLPGGAFARHGQRGINRIGRQTQIAGPAAQLAKQVKTERVGGGRRGTGAVTGGRKRHGGGGMRIDKKDDTGQRQNGRHDLQNP